jgi:hypothetical protein
MGPSLEARVGGRCSSTAGAECGSRLEAELVLIVVMVEGSHGAADIETLLAASLFR